MNFGRVGRRMGARSLLFPTAPIAPVGIRISPMPVTRAANRLPMADIFTCTTWQAAKHGDCPMSRHTKRQAGSTNRCWLFPAATRSICSIRSGASGKQISTAGEVREVRSPGDSATNYLSEAWSPSGIRVLVQLADTGNRTALLLADGTLVSEDSRLAFPRFGMAAAWSPNGGRLAIGGSGGQLSLWRARQEWRLRIGRERLSTADYVRPAIFARRRVPGIQRR